MLANQVVWKKYLARYKSASLEREAAILKLFAYIQSLSRLDRERFIIYNKPDRKEGGVIDQLSVCAIAQGFISLDVFTDLHIGCVPYVIMTAKLFTDSVKMLPAYIFTVKFKAVPPQVKKA